MTKRSKFTSSHRHKCWKAEHWQFETTDKSGNVTFELTSSAGATLPRRQLLLSFNHWVWTTPSAPMCPFVKSYRPRVSTVMLMSVCIDGQRKPEVKSGSSDAHPPRLLPDKQLNFFSLPLHLILHFPTAPSSWGQLGVCLCGIPEVEALPVRQNREGSTQGLLSTDQHNPERNTRNQPNIRAYTLIHTLIITHTFW